MTAIAGPWTSRVAEVAIATTLSGSYGDCEAVKSPNLSGTQKTADITSNDSGGWEENLPTLKNASLKFSAVANEAATVQEQLWDAWENGAQLFFRLRGHGNVNNAKQVRWQGTVVNVEEDLSLEGAAGYAFTIQFSGAPTIDLASI